MKSSKLIPSSMCVAVLVMSVAIAISSDRPGSRGIDRRPRQVRFQHTGTVGDEAPASYPNGNPNATEAPTGFDNVSNGFTDQGPDFDTLNEDNVVPLRSFNDNRFIFEEVETVANGLGPTYNAQSCRECHQSVVSGNASQITEFRSGRATPGGFFNSLGGSLIQSRATYPEIVEQIAIEDNTRTFRISTSTLGDGFVECIANSTLYAIRNAQPVFMRGTPLIVPILELTNSPSRIGRFGWKSQHASLESFAADAYLNEMGITSPMMPEENTANGRFVGYGSQYDPVDEAEDDGEDVKAFASFMRSTKAPPRGPVTASVLAGEQVFNQIGCAVCHAPSITTAPSGTKINGGAFTVPDALGNKIIHPYSDFLLHNIGSGDGIPVLPTLEYASTANQLRTAPLWGLRTRNRLMHDGLSFTKQDAIRRHAGQAMGVTGKFNLLQNLQKQQLLDFLDSL